MGEPGKESVDGETKEDNSVTSEQVSFDETAEDLSHLEVVTNEEILMVEAAARRRRRMVEATSKSPRRMRWTTPRPVLPSAIPQASPSPPPRYQRRFLAVVAAQSVAAPARLTPRWAPQPSTSA